MKRLFVLVAVLVSSTWFIAGCGGEGSSEKGKQSVQMKQHAEEFGAKMQQQMQKAQQGGIPQK